MCHDWPRPPIWPEEECAELVRKMVLPNGPRLDYTQAFGEQELKAPNAAGTLGATGFATHVGLGVSADVRPGVNYLTNHTVTPTFSTSDHSKS